MMILPLKVPLGAGTAPLPETGKRAVDLREPRYGIEP
jgi:hypothetical protein